MVPEIELNSGKKMPAIGFGTGMYPIPPYQELYSAIHDAIESGYRHFDTAEAYCSEQPLGDAISAALRGGLLKNRDDVFITSKVWCNHADPLLVLPALKATLQRLGMEYVDLYLIHWPVRVKEETTAMVFNKNDIIPFDMKGTWEAMEQCYKLGLAKSIGVSNFSIKKLQMLLLHATIPPAVNQVEMNVSWQQEKLRIFCKKKGIHVCAWSTLGAIGGPHASEAVMESSIIKDIAVTKGKSMAQIALRWIHEQEATPIVRSSSKERMKNNLQIFDWELSQDELAKIKEIPQCRGFPGDYFVAPNGTVEELWDEEH